MAYPQIIQTLIEYFQKLPSVGPKTAERYVFYLLKNRNINLHDLATNLANLRKNLTTCSNCLVISEEDPCPICASDRRDKKTLCLVANTQEMASMENTHKYNGLYFILGGLISTIDNINPENLNVKALLKKIKTDNIEEVIMAFSPTIEGETTVLYLKKLLETYDIKLSRLARGLPAGASLEYADEITLSEALKYRNQIQ
ncbi:MAG: recombination mediator RecR [Candidatus Pacebacteria bacterium]|nr:recombination mediator RecR [Candidatus Paceibacterota bacterium]